MAYFDRIGERPRSPGFLRFSTLIVNRLVCSLLRGDAEFPRILVATGQVGPNLGSKLDFI